MCKQSCQDSGHCWGAMFLVFSIARRGINSAAKSYDPELKYKFSNNFR